MDLLRAKLGDLVTGGLFPNYITFITQILSTIILFLFLKNLVWEPMREFLAKRSNVIVGELESAKQARLEAEQMREEYVADLKHAKAEAANILENARKQALELKQQIVSEAEKEASYKLEKADKDINAERSRIEQELKSHVIDIAFSAAEKLVNENINDSKNRQLIDKFIKEVE